MKNRKAIIFLISVIAALTAANVYFAQNGRVATRTTRSSIWSAAQPLPEKVTIRRGTEELTIVKDDGWRFVAPFAGAADEATIMRMLDTLITAPITDTLSYGELERLGIDHEQLGLEVPRVSLDISTVEQQLLVDFGSATPTGDGVYVKIGGEQRIYLAASNILETIDLPIKMFRPRAVIDCSPKDIVSLDLKRGTGSPMRFVRGEDGWMMTLPREARAGTERLKKLLESMSSVRVIDWVWPRGATNETEIASSSFLAGYGLDPDSSLTVSLKDARGNDVRLSLGDPADNDSVYALMPGAAAVVTVSAAVKELAEGESAYFTDLRLFPVDRMAVKSVSIADGNVACLLRADETGSWRMESPVEAPVDELAMEALMQRMLTIGPSDIVTNGVVVSVSTNLPSVMVSKSALFGSGGLESLRSRLILKINAQLIKRLVITDREGKPATLGYNRESRKWAVDSPQVESGEAREDIAVELDEEALNAIVGAMNPLVAVTVAKLKPASMRLGEYGLDQPLRTIAIDSVGENAARRTILIGGRLADGGRYATVGSSDAVFVLSPETARILLRDFVAGDMSRGRERAE